MINNLKQISRMKIIDKNVYRIIRKVGYKRGYITESASLKDDLGFDRIDILQMTNMLEYKFKLIIDEQDVFKLCTVKSVIEYLNQNNERAN